MRTSPATDIPVDLSGVARLLVANPGFVASVLDRAPVELVAALGLDGRGLARLALCRAPRHDQDVAVIAAFVGVEPGALRAVIAAA